MQFSNLELPSNRKFGLLFAAVFFIGFLYFYFENIVEASIVFILFSAGFFLIALFKADVLRPLNRLWMMFGFFLGLVVSPIVLGFVFFGLFAPIAIFTKIMGRDELRLQSPPKTTHWIDRNSEVYYGSLRNQF